MKEKNDTLDKDKFEQSLLMITKLNNCFSCDFRRRQFKKSLNRAEREGYAKETVGVLAWQ